MGTSKPGKDSMKLTNNKLGGLYWFHFIFSILLLLIYACGDGSGATDNTSLNESDSGSISFSIDWADTTAIPSSGDYFMNTAIDCDADDVAWLTCEVYGRGPTFLASNGENPWPCSDHGGTIDGVPVGTNRQLVFLARDSDNNIVRHAQSEADIEVEAHHTTYISNITAHSFIPTLSGPMNGTSLSTDKATLTWNNVKNAYEYRIHVSKDIDFATYIINDTTTNTLYSAENLPTATTLYWKVFARDIFSNEGAQSEVRTFTIDEAPNAPSALVTVVDADSCDDIRLSWNEPAESVGVTEYNVYRNGNFLKTVTETSTTDRGQDAQLYCYTVTAYDQADNESVHSNQDCAASNDCTAPECVTEVTAAAFYVSTRNGITVNWTPATDNVALEQYCITRTNIASNPRFVSVDLGCHPSNITSYTDQYGDGNEMNTHTEYCYRLTALDEAGNTSSYDTGCLFGPDNCARIADALP